MKKIIICFCITIQSLFSQIELQKEEFIGNTYRLNFSNRGYSYSIDVKSRRISFNDIHGEGKPSSFALPQKEIFIAIPPSQNPKFSFSVKNQNTINGGQLSDIGIGLRIALDRTAFANMLHVDLAMPLNRAPGIKPVQFLIKSEFSF